MLQITLPPHSSDAKGTESHIEDISAKLMTIIVLQLFSDAQLVETTFFHYKEPLVKRKVYGQ